MAHYFIANHERRFVAIASPKCGSTAVRRWYLETTGADPTRLRAVGPNLVDPEHLSDLGDYERILFVRDPLRRLVGFYWQWVVRDQTLWCFADDERERSLEGVTFREMIDAVEAMRREDRVLQHHLLDQVALLPTDRIPDRLALVEQLADELAALNTRYGLTGASTPRARAMSSSYAEPVMDCPAAWFRERKDELAPRFELFYDRELAERARRCFATDCALHASIPDASPLAV